MGLKKNIKILIGLALSLMLCLMLVPVIDTHAGYGELPMATGNGWYLEQDGSLYFINDITNESTYEEDLTPWKAYKDKITSVYASTGSSINNCNSLFDGCSNVTSIDISRLNTSKATDMYHMFYGCGKLTNLNMKGIDTSNVTDMTSMFFNCSSLENIDVSGFKTSKVKYFSNMFALCSKVEDIDVSGFNTAQAYTFAGMFSNCTKLKKIDVSSFSTEKWQSFNMGSMLAFCDAISEIKVNRAMFSYLKERIFEIYPTWCDLATGKTYTLEEADSIDWTVNTKTFASCIASGKGWYIDGNGCLYITGAIERRSASFADATPWYYYKDSITAVVALEGSSIDNCKKLFQNYDNLVSADLRKLDTSSVTDMSYMFQCCSELTTLEMLGINTANVTIMNSMFELCRKLEYVDVRSFDTSKVTTMSCMFSGCNALTNLDVSRFKTSNVTSMFDMFYNCQMLDYIDVRGFDTSKVENMGAMFYGCSRLNRVDVSDFNINNCWNFANMFSDCYDLMEIGINENLLSKVTSQLIDIHSIWTDRDSASKVYEGAGDLIRIPGKVYLIKGIFYNIWVGNVPVTSTNRLDVFGDGGSVSFYPDIKEYNADLAGEGLVLNNMRLDKARYHTTEEGRFCMFYLGRDTCVYLEGDNVINYTWQDDIDGMFIPVDSYVSFWGGGNLTIKVSNNGGRALATSNSTIATYDRVTLDLTGNYGYYCGYKLSHDTGWLDLYDDSKVYLYGLRTDDDKEGLALLGCEVTVSDNAYLYAEYEWNQPVMNTWGATFEVNAPITIRGIKNISGTLNREWTTLPSINAGNGTPHESDYRALEIKANKVIKNGIIEGTDGKLYYYKDNVIRSDYTGITRYDGEYCYFVNGVCANNYKGLVKNDGVFWYVENSKILTDYTGFFENAAGTWYVKNGKVDTTFTGLALYGGKWLCVRNGRYYPDYTGMVQNGGAWWYVENGELNTSFSGLYTNDGGTWFVKNGKIATEATGIFTANGKFYYVTNGKAAVNFTGIVKANDAFWYVENGVVNTNYTGIFTNSSGQWYIVNGKLQMITGTVTVNGVTYKLKDGKVVG